MQIGNNMTVNNSSSRGVNKITIRYFDSAIVLIETIPNNSENSRLITINKGNIDSMRSINRALRFHDIPLVLYPYDDTFYIRNLTTGKIYNYSDNIELAA